MKTIVKDFISLFRKEPLILAILCWLLFSGSTLSTYATLILVPYMLPRARTKRYIDGVFLCILVYSITYALFTSINGWYMGAKGNIVFQSLYPPLFYLLGRLMVDKYSQYIYMLLMLLAGLMAISVYVEVINDIAANQFINPLRLMESENNATYLGLRVSLSVVCISVIFSKINDSRERTYQIVFLIFSLLGLMCVIHLINRTGLVLAVVSIVCVLLFNIKQMKATDIIAMLLFVGIIIFYITSNAGLFEVTEAYSARNDGVSSVASMGGRESLWASGIESLFINPFGTDVSEKMRYAHNYWLDTARTAGLFPFIFLIILTIWHVKESVALIRKLNAGLLKTLLIACNVGFLLTFFVEPVMEGFMNYVFVFFMFMGITVQLNLRSKQRLTVSK